MDGKARLVLHGNVPVLEVTFEYLLQSGEHVVRLQHLSYSNHLDQLDGGVDRQVSVRDQRIFAVADSGIDDLCGSQEWILTRGQQDGERPKSMRIHNVTRMLTGQEGTLSQIGTWRLLLMDGHGSHYAFEFLDYRTGTDIIPFCLPPHTAHIL